MPALIPGYPPGLGLTDIFGMLFSGIPTTFFESVFRCAGVNLAIQELLF